MTAESKPMPPRIVHLTGGLRAVDDRIGPVDIQVSADRKIAHFPAPEYGELYRNLYSLGLGVIGVEFVSEDSRRGLIAPNWQCLWPSGGFKVREERNHWNCVRHAAVNDRAFAVVEFASKASTYLDLLSIRILELSRAYNRTLCARVAGGPDDALYFQNTFCPYIDAAIHAFAADAASFRDHMAVGVWKLVLKETEKVTVLSTFLKKAKSHPHPMAQSIVAAGADGGWLKNLGQLRDHITHVAPVSQASGFHFCEPRKMQLGPTVEAMTVHYPLLDASGAIWKESDPVDFTDEAQLRATLERYRQFVDTSIDALGYAWTTLGQLIDLLTALRMASGLRSEMPTLTEEDLVGEVTVRGVR